jgi:hypothetical protein
MPNDNVGEARGLAVERQRRLAAGVDPSDLDGYTVEEQAAAKAALQAGVSLDGVHPDEDPARPAPPKAELLEGGRQHKPGSSYLG